jgi:cysteinyl-tRNA synthetase
LSQLWLQQEYGRRKRQQRQGAYRRQPGNSDSCKDRAQHLALGCLPPTHEPRATEYIAPMIKMIEALIATGHAYPAEGHVLFDVSSKRDYGKLSNRSVDE